MRSTRADGDTLAPPGNDPLGSAARLRRARLDPDVLGARAAHAVVDTVALLLLLAVPALATLVAVALLPGTAAAGAPAVVPATAVVLASVAVLVGFAVVWPAHDGGRTAGMRWAGVRVVDRLGRPASPGQLAARAALVPADVLVGPVLVLARADRRRLGDLVAGTQVVRDLSAGAGPAGRPGTARTPRARSRTAAPPRPR